MSSSIARGRSLSAEMLFMFPPCVVRMPGEVGTGSPSGAGRFTLQGHARAGGAAVTPPDASTGSAGSPGAEEKGAVSSCWRGFASCGK